MIRLDYRSLVLLISFFFLFLSLLELAESDKIVEEALRAPLKENLSEYPFSYLCSGFHSLLSLGSFLAEALDKYFFLSHLRIHLYQATKDC